MPISEIGFIEKVSAVAAELETIGKAADLYDAATIAALSSISDLDLDTLVADLTKSNYLGNRKLDIDLTLNNLSDVTNVAYQQADILFKDGITVNIPFYTIPGNSGSGITELTSHADIKNYIANDTAFIAKVLDTELTVEPAIGIFNEVIRFRDSDGQSSNVDRLTLTYFSGTAVETLPNYYWALTTSSLQTIASRVSDIIKLGDNIDDIIALSNLSVEISALNAISADITTVAGIQANVTAVAAALTAINGVYADLAAINTNNANSANINIVATNDVNITAVADTVVPNMTEILLADDNAATATAEASNSATSATNSEDSNLESEDWANQTEDVLTRTFISSVGTNRLAGNYSALHWAAKAAADQILTAGDASAASASAGNASTSETNANTSKLASEDSNLEAEDWSNQLEDVLTRIFTGGVPSNRGAGNYSALHYSGKSSTSASGAATSETNASNSESAAAASEASALAHLNAITGLSATALTLVAGSSASANYNSSTGVLTLGIPVGDKGDRGDAFNIDASGPIANRSTYDGAATGFSYLSTDEDPTKVYFKNSATSGDWSVGVAFGKGDQGDQGIQGLGWYSGSGVPSDATGSDGEYYLDLDNGDVYEKSAGTWGTASTNLAAGINDAIVSTAYSYSSSKVVDLLKNKIEVNDVVSDFVVTGLLPVTDAGLTSNISAGTAYIIGKRTVKASTPNTYTASKDTYVDLDNAGTYTFVETVLGAGAPGITGSSIRLAKVVTDGTAITSVTDLRQSAVVIDGRQISTDGTKLDGIEDNATADQTKGDIDALGINADLLDGVEGAGYLQVGAFGVGGVPVLTTDFDALLPANNGSHYCNAVATGTPTASAWWNILSHMLSSAGGVQYAQNAVDGSGFFMRRKVSNVWQAWVKLHDVSDIGSIVQAYSAALDNVSGTNTGDQDKANIDALGVDAATLDGNLPSAFEPADGTILKDADIGVNVQAYDVDTAKKDIKQQWTKQQYFQTIVLTDGVNIDWNVDNPVALLTLGGNRTMNLPSSIVNGAFYTLRILQDATGSRTLAWDAGFRFGPDGAPALSTIANAFDYMTFVGHGSTSLAFMGIVYNVTNIV